MSSQAYYEPVQTSDSNSSNHHHLQESLVGNRPNITQTVSATPQIEVEAPADLPEGYEFRVSLGGTTNNGKTFVVTVPPGGVERGQKWTVPLSSSSSGNINSEDDDNSSFLYPQQQQQQHSVHIPVGHWRDGLFGIFNYGVCHPHAWTACCCSLCKCKKYSIIIEIARWNTMETNCTM